MTKSELRKARKAAREQGKPLDGDLAINGRDETPAPIKPQRRVYRERYTSRERLARFLGQFDPGAWDA